MIKVFVKISGLFVIGKQTKYSLVYPMIYSLVISAFFYPNNVDASDSLKNKEQGIFLNVPADALMNHTRWGADIDSISKEKAIAALEEYVIQYANTQVNRLLFNVNYLRACYDSKIITPYWDVPDPSVNTSEWCRKYWQVNKKEIDVFEVCVAQSREMGTSPWLSFRMNDHHYRDNPYRLSTFMLEHPEFRISPTSSFDFAHSEVREFYKSFIREALERYDVDGIELDWMRTHIVFKPGMESQGIGIMNIFMKEIRAIVEQNASERGHPIEIAARVPSTPAIGRSFGLDGVAWAKDHSVDIIIPSNFFRPTNFDLPVEKWTGEIGNMDSCMIVSGADAAFMFKSNTSRHMINSIETMRAFAISAYNRGAGSVYLFNNHSWTFEKKIVNPDGSTIKTNDKPLIIKEGGKISTIEDKPRRHVVTYTSPDIISVSLNPLIMQKNVKKEFNIHTGPKPSRGDFIIRVALQNRTGYENAGFEVKVNDRSCMQIKDTPRDNNFIYDKTIAGGLAKDVSETGSRVLQFKSDLIAVNEGYNRISIVNIQEVVQEITWLEVYIPFNDQFNVQIEFIDSLSQKPLEGMEVILQGLNYLTNEQGTISIPELTEGVHQLVIPDSRISFTGDGIIDVRSDSLIRVIVKKIPHLLLKVINKTTNNPIYRAVIKAGENTYYSNSSGIINLGEYQTGFLCLSASQTDYFTEYDSLLFDRDTTIVFALTPTRANVIFRVSDLSGLLSAARVYMTGSQLTNSNGNAFFFFQPARENYSYSVEKAGYCTTYDSLYLETDTIINILINTLTSVHKMTEDNILVSPNPFDKEIIIDVSEISQLYLTDLSGILKLSMKLEVGRNIIPAERLQTGVYILKIVDSKGYYNKLIIK